MVAWGEGFTQEGEILDAWECEFCSVLTVATGKCDSRGQELVAYKLTDKGSGEVIFEGDDYSPSPLRAIDSDEAMGGLLGFLSLRPGDTDPEYFENYTERQLEWAQEHGEELSYLASVLEGEDE